MAVPVISTKSVTKATMTIKKQTQSYNHGIGTTYTELTTLRQTGVVDGEYLSLVLSTHNNTTHNGDVRLRGVTSGTVIYEHIGIAGNIHEDYGIRNLVKTTGVTEDIAVELKSNGNNFHTGGSSWLIKCASPIEFVPIMRGYPTVIKTTMHIDSIDMAGLILQYDKVACPTVGFYGGTGNDITPSTHNPNKMFNELVFTSANTTLTIDLQLSHNYIVYTYTGKELTMS